MTGIPICGIYGAISTLVRPKSITNAITPSPPRSNGGAVQERANPPTSLFFLSRRLDTILTKLTQLLARKQASNMPTLTKLYSMQEASQHNTSSDCWVVIDGKVYDVSTYLDDHPGGDDVLLAATGKDATDEFEDAGHSEDARVLMETFCIGELDEMPSDMPELEIITSKNEPAGYAQTLVDLTTQYWAVPVAVVGISVVAGFLYLRKK